MKVFGAKYFTVKRTGAGNRPKLQVMQDCQERLKKIVNEKKDEHLEQETQLERIGYLTYKQRIHPSKDTTNSVKSLFIQLATYSYKKIDT